MRANKFILIGLYTCFYRVYEICRLRAYGYRQFVTMTYSGKYRTNDRCRLREVVKVQKFEIAWKQLIYYNL
jgi:hypothetical protein